ncbi:hypothetical protein Btru_005014 [Bulinus truncatus]|nr:hypothetical protein Btru_005014 [Bulinus truncatus]
MLEACDKKYVSKEQQFNADREFKSTFDADYKKIINERETPSVNDIREIYLKHHKEIEEIDHRHQKEIGEINVRHKKEINEIDHRHQEEITEIYKQVLGKCPPTCTLL